MSRSNLQHVPRFAKRVSKWWNQVWFPESTGVRLAICRILVIWGQLFFFMPHLDAHLGLIRYNERFTTPLAITQVSTLLFSEQLIRTPAVMTGIYWMTVIAGCLALFGWLTRVSCFVFALGIAFQVSHLYAYGEFHHPEALTSIFLFLLAFSDSGRCYSVDAWLAKRTSRARQSNKTRITTRYAFWPLLLTQILIALSYLDAGLSKLHTGGVQWLNGYTMQWYLLTGGIRAQCPLGVWIAEQYWLCVAFGYFSVVFETTFIVAVVWRRLLVGFVFLGLAFHFGIYLTVGPAFFPTMILYCVFLPFHRWLVRDQVKRLAV